MAEDNTAKNKRLLGETGEVVRTNIKRIREQRRRAVTALSTDLEKLGRPIPPLGLRRIESGDRRVDVDDLAAIAVALNVSPATLLMPVAANEESAVSLTGASARPAEDVWAWLTAAKPLKDESSPISENDQWVVFMHDAWPIWRVRQIYGTTFEEMQRQANAGPNRANRDGNDQ